MADACALVNESELREEHRAYVRDIADRLGLTPDVVTPVFRETLRALSSDAKVETFVLLLAAKKTLVELKKRSGQR